MYPENISKVIWKNVFMDSIKKMKTPTIYAYHVTFGSTSVPTPPDAWVFGHNFYEAFKKNYTDMILAWNFSQIQLDPE